MLLKFSKFFLYLSVFCVVIVMSSTFFPFIGGKYYFFRASIGLSLIFFILWLVYEAEPEEMDEFKKKICHPLFIAVSIFVFIYLLASLFAYDISGAFWSNYERGEGAFQMLHYYAFFVLLVFIFKDDEWRKIFKYSLAAAVLMILYGVLALFKVENFIGPDLCGRFQGALGNPAYVAPYLMFSMFFTAWLWLSGKKTWLKNIIYGVLTIGFFFFFMLSQTRGAFIGLGVAVLFGLIYLALFLPAGVKRKIAVVVLIVYVVLTTLTVFFRHREIPVIPFCSSSSRLLEVSLSQKSGQTRLWTWGTAIQGFKERPLLGWGPENFSVVFDKYFDPRHYVPGQSSETWFDRAHSVFFDYLAETGIFGLLSYLGIFAVFSYLFVNKILKKRIITRKSGREIGDVYSVSDLGSIMKDVLFLILPVGYLIQGLILFETIPLYLNIFLFLAFSTYIFNDFDEEAENRRL